MSEFIKEKYTAEGTVKVHGQTIPWHAVTENFPVTDAAGNVDATMFTTSYERSDLASTTGRPVLFAWNGGPGCGSLYVHMGLLSPMRVKCGEGPDMPQTAPFEIINNDGCLLDVCDVVAVDAIGTGYARLLNQGAKATYCSTESDAAVFALCIRQWLTAHNRWNSPVYIMGESYGTIRTAMVADTLFYSSQIDGAGTPLMVSGIINLGSALNYGQEKFPIPDAVLNLPSIAAAYLYHHPDGKHTVAEIVDECDRFCYEEYVPALALGSRLPADRALKVAKKLSKYTGYPVQKLLDDKLVVDVFKYPAQGFAAEGRSVGIYDSRFVLGKIGADGYDYFSDDASNALIMPAFSAVFNGIWKQALNIDTQADYQEIWNGAEGSWNFKTKTSPITLLEKAMHRNPKLKVMFGMGYYDMLTTIGWVRYLVSHYDLPADRLALHYYEAGHMPYIGDRQALQLEDDIRSFIKGEE